ncbi:hypothetical protein [Streptomyces sp. NPDC003036]|uniref:hypothetical protein n=1 Tax=Streptomyces sp. NPDC003036 TaxID=3154442 RepID=UPI00339F1A4A
MSRTRKAGYDGPLRMGVDRMTVEIGATAVDVRRPIPTAGLPDLDSPETRL